MDVGLNIEYGQHLVKVSQQAQRSICENIELMTGLKVKTVNVSVQGVCLPKSQDAQQSHKGQGVQKGQGAS